MVNIAKANKIEVLKLLLEDERIDVSYDLNDFGVTPLMQTYYENDDDYEFLEVFANHPRVDLTAVDRDKGQTALHKSAHCKDPYRTEILLKAAIKRGIDVNQREYSGLTMVHLAFDFDRYYFTVTHPYTIEKFSPTIDVIFKHREEAGIDLEATDNSGRTPLHYLCSSRCEEYVRHFIDTAKEEYGLQFNLDAKDNDGRTPFQCFE